MYTVQLEPSSRNFQHPLCPLMGLVASVVLSWTLPNPISRLQCALLMMSSLDSLLAMHYSVRFKIYMKMNKLTETVTEYN